MESTPPSRWWSEETIAVVTGGNKGIGYAIVKKLAEVGVTVILTARNAQRGETAVAHLKHTGFENVHFRSLDVSCRNSIKEFVSWFHQKFRLLDILVNNAAVSFNNIKENSVEHSKIVIGTNYYGAKLLTESLLPYFRRSGNFMSRILNVSSRLGALDKVRNEEIKAVLKDDTLTEEQISNIVGLFLKSVENGTWEKQGWPEVWTDYAVSKLALNSYTKVLAKQNEGFGLCVNCFCPGFTQTGMTGGVGKRTADDAAKLAVAIVLASPESVSTGKFYVGEDPHSALKCRL